MRVIVETAEFDNVKSVELHCSEVEFLIIRAGLRMYSTNKRVNKINKIIAKEMLDVDWIIKEREE